MSKVHEDNAGYVGVSYEETQDPYFSYNKLSLPLSESQLSAVQPAEETFTVTVANSKFVVDGVSQASLNLIEGGVYKFDQSDSSNTGHPLRFSYTEDGTHGGGQEYTLGVTTNGTPGSAGAYTKIVVPFGLHDLYYYCSVHSGYGGFANVAKDPFKFTTGLPILKTTDALGKTLGSGNNEDPYAANLVLAIPMNGANNGTTFTDVSNVIRGSGSAQSISVAGDTKTVTSEFQFYGSSAAFDNSGDYLSLPDTSALHLNGAECTIEGWFYTNDAPGAGGGNAVPFFAQADVNASSTSSSANFWSFADSTLWYFGSSTGFMSISSSNVPVGSWFHFACVVTNTTQAKMFVNGELKGEGTIGAIGSGTSRTTNLGVITSGTNQKSYLNGYIQDFRMYNIAKYTTPFPTGSYGMDVVTYTGNSSTQTISGLNFEPDLLWIKSRSTAYSHRLFDRVRGTDALYPDIADTEGNNSINENLISYNSDGFTVGSTSGVNALNNNGTTFVAWAWKAGGTASLNENGSIDSQVSANTTHGFSIVTYTGTGVAETVGHGLDEAPQLIIAKARTATEHWQVGHTSIGWTKRLFLSLNNTTDTSTAAWNDTAPTSTVFSIGNSGNINNVTTTYVAYCWSEVAGFSKFGTYEGASTVTVTTGFKPRWILLKNVDIAGSWSIFDSERDSDLEINHRIYANESSIEGTNIVIGNFTDTGFTLTNQGNSNWNTTGDTFVYAAFAESAAGEGFESAIVDQLDLKDRSGNDNNASNAGATWQTSVSKFYGGAVAFTGGTNVNVPNSSELQFGTGDFTIEGWIHPTSYGVTYPTVVSKYDNSDVSWILRLHSSGQIVWYNGAGGGTNSATSSGLSLLNQWSHIAVVRQAGVTKVYLNGSQVLSVADTFNYDDTNAIYFGRQDANNANGLEGYLQDFRLYKSIAKYTSSFSPPERSVQGTARRYPSGIYVVS